MNCNTRQLTRLVANSRFLVHAKQEKSPLTMRLAAQPMAERAQAALTMASAVVLMGSVAVAYSIARLTTGKHGFLAPLCTERLITDGANSVIAKRITVLATPPPLERECRTCGQSACKRLSRLPLWISRANCETSMLYGVVDLGVSLRRERFVYRSQVTR